MDLRWAFSCTLFKGESHMEKTNETATPTRLYKDSVFRFRQIAEENQEAGEAKGRTMEKLSNLKSLMETLGLTAEQAMAALQVPEDEREKYMKMLNQ